VRFTRTMTKAVQSELEDLASWLGLGNRTDSPTTSSKESGVATRLVALTNVRS
jgi:hypothetical protein